MNEHTRDLPPSLQAWLTRAEDARWRNQRPPSMKLEELFRGADASLAEQLRSSGMAHFTTKDGKDGTLVAEFDKDGNVFSVAAAIPRNVGRADNYLRQVRDFTDTTMDRSVRIPLYRNIYKSEGIVNNAINKIAALIATQGAFRVRYVKGQRGKGGDKQAEELRQILQFWVENVNARALDAVLTGARGINSVISQSCRLALIEGSSVMRTIWSNVKVPSLGGKAYSLPMNIQMFHADHIEIPDDAAGLFEEVIYWVPPGDMIQRMLNPQDVNVKKVIRKYLSSDVLNQLNKNKKYLLDPSLIVHIKHRGGPDAYGESMIEPAMTDIAYKRALMALEITTLESLINRLLVIKIGSDVDGSPYRDPDVANSRTQSFKKLIQTIGTSATIVWSGPDLDVIDIGAHGKIQDLDGRMGIADGRIRASLGVAAALLTGEGGDGKAAGWAAFAGILAQLTELQDQYAQFLKSMAERISIENNYEGVDVVWEFAGDMMQDKEINSNIALKAFQLGLYSTQTTLEELGQSPEAEEIRQQYDAEMKYKDKAFGPPLGAQTTNPAAGAPGAGRPRNTQRPTKNPDPRKNRETKTTTENK